jgi:integrase/recombinase XerD
MGQVGERLWVLLHEPEGPLVAYLNAFASHLDAQGFKRHLLGRQIRQAAKFSRWLQSARVAASAVTEEHVQRFLWETAQRRPVRQGTAATLRRLIDYLRQLGIIDASASTELTSVQQTVAEFAEYLRTERELSGTTLIQYCSFAESFLSQQFGTG